MNKKYFIPFWIIFGIGIAFLIVCMCFNLFHVQNNEWLQAIVGWFGTCGAVFIGLVAIAQNEKFDKANKDAQEKAEQKSKEYQDKLLEINDRMLKLEESTKYAFVTFTKDNATILPASEYVFADKNTYIGCVGNAVEEDHTIIGLCLKNQTDVPIRHIEIKNFVLSYDYRHRKSIDIFTWNKKCGYISALNFDDNKKAYYEILIFGVKNLVENLPKDYKICLVMDLEVVSIYGNMVNQKFMIELKQSIDDYNKKTNVFYPTVFESKPELKGSVD